MRRTILAATWFGAGTLPYAPGTWGSLAALPFAWLIVTVGGPGLLALLTLALFIAGCPIAGAAARDAGIKDPGWIVIDEVVGQWATLLLAPLSSAGYAAGFVLFRVFDIWKPWPIGWADRRLDGGFGIMADDLLAAIYAGAILGLGRLVLER